MTDKPLHQAFEGSARAPAPQATVARATETIDQKEARITEMAERHFEKHRNSWAVSRYNELLKKDSPAPSLKPHGLKEDRTSHLVRTANYLATRKQLTRLYLIKDAAHRMREGKERDGLER